MPGPDKEMMRAVRNLIRENEDVRLTAKALEARGVPRGEAELEITRAFLGCFWEVHHGKPDRWPAVCFEDCAKGNLAASYFPTGCTT